MHSNDNEDQVLQGASVLSEEKQPGSSSQAPRRMKASRDLLQVSRLVLAETPLEDLLQAITDTARKIIGANLGASGYGYLNGGFRVNVLSKANLDVGFPPEKFFELHLGGAFLKIIDNHDAIRLSGQELQKDPCWLGMPTLTSSLRGLLGVPLIGKDGKTIGLITLSDKEGGREFDEDDQNLLEHLASMASLGLTHIELQREAQKAKQLLEGTLQHLPIGITITDPDGNIVSASRYWFRMNKLDNEGDSNQKFDAQSGEVRIHHPETLMPASSEELPIYRVLSKEEIIKGEEWILQDSQGGLTPVMVSAGPLRDGTGHPIGAITVWYDIRERKLHEEQMERARRLADQANQAKTKFLSNMSHEIRTPLNSIIGLSQLLLETELDGQQKEWTGSLLSSADHLLNLVDDVLDLAKVESQALILRHEEFDLEEVLQYVITATAPKAFKKELELVCHLDLDVPQALTGDESRLKQILLNLVGNAVKYTDSGHVVIRCKKQKVDKTKVKLYFEISDTGLGIAPNVQDKLFERFYQPGIGADHVEDGSGLGLAIAKHLVGMMGGNIGLHSQVGIGSSFWFTATFDMQNPQDLRSNEWNLTQDIRDSRILALDKNQAIREMLTDYLKSWDCRYSITYSIKEAKELCRQAREARDPFQIMLIDWNLLEHPKSEHWAGLADAWLEDKKSTILTIPMDMNLSEQGFEGVDDLEILYKPITASALFDSLMAIRSNSPRQNHRSVGNLIIPNNTELKLKRSDKQILVVDDNHTNRLVALAVLHKLGYEADGAAGGEEALHSLAFTNYDLVLMDIKMPGMDGLATTRAIRNLDNDLINHQVPIFALSANATKEEYDQALNAGMDDYLSKPIRPQALAKALDRRLLGVAIKQTNDGLDENEKPYSRAIFLQKEALDRFSNDRQVLVMVVQQLLNDFPQQIKSLRAAVSLKNLAETESIAHTIKGAAANVSAHGSQEAARKLEASAKSGDWVKTAKLAKDLEREVERFCFAVKEQGLV